MRIIKLCDLLLWGVYWTKVRNFESFIIKNDKKERSTADRIIYIREDINTNLIVSILNSTLHYWFWLMFSDCRNKKRVMCAFPINIDEIPPLINKKLIDYGKELMKDYKNKSEHVCRILSEKV